MLYYHQKIKDQDTNNLQGIALPSVKKLQQAIVLRDSSTIYHTGKIDKIEKPLTPTARMAKMTDFMYGIQQIASTVNTQKTLTTEELMSRAIQQDSAMMFYLNSAKTSIDVGTQREAYARAKRTGKFISYDMENLGGTDEFGANRFDFLTELAYTEGDMNNHSVETAIGRTRQYLFGLSDQEYKQIVKEVSSKDFVYNSGRGKVLFDRLAIMGHEDTVVKGNKVLHEGKLGAGVPSLDMVLRGAKVLREAGIRDEATRTADGLTDGDRFKLEFFAKAKNNVVAGHNILGFDNLKMGVLGYSMNDTQSLDTLSIYRAAASRASKEELLNATKVLANKSGFTQENLVDLILGNQSSMTAHTASVDSALHSLIVSSPELQRIVDKYMPETAARTAIKPGQALFHINQNNYGDYKGLSFINLPTGEMRTGSGFSFDGKNISSDSFKTSALRKGGIYSFEGSGSIALSDAERTAMRHINADYAQKELYYVNLKPHGIDGTLESDSVITEVFHSKNAMHEFMAANDLIGIRNNIKEEFNLPAGALGAHAEQVMTLHNLGDKTSKTLSLGEFIEHKNSFSKNDRPSRKLRSFELKDAKRTQELLKTIQESLGGVSIANVSGLGFTHDYKIAANMADGSSVATSIGMDGLRNIIGHRYNGEEKLYYQTVDNLLSQSPFHMRNYGTMQQVMQFVENNYGKTSKEQQEEAYRTLMQGLVNENISYGDLKVNDLNYVEINKNMIRTARKGVETKTSLNAKDSLRINLDTNNADAKLINTLMNHRYGKQEFTPADYNLQARSVLKDFSKAMRLDIDIDKYEDAGILSDKIINVLKDQKQSDPFYGIIETKTQVEDLINGVTINTDGLEERLQAHSKSIKKVQQLNPEDLAKRVADTFNTKIDDRYFYQFGFEEKQAKFMHQMHERIIKEQQDFFCHVFKEFNQIPGLELILEGQSFFAKYGDTTVDLAKYIPQYKVHGQMSYFQIGRSQVASNGVLFANSPRDIYMGSNIKRAADDVRFSYRGHRESVAQGYGNAAKGMQMVFSLFGSNLRESPDVSSKNMMNLNSPFMVDYNQVMGLAGIMAKNGDIKINDSEELKTLMKFSDNGEKTVNMKDTDQHFRSIARRHLDEMLYIVANGKSENSLEYFAASNLGPYGTESYVNNGYANVGNNSHMAHYDLEQGKRLTAHQNNFYSFNKKEAQSLYDTINSYATGSAMPAFRFGAGATTQAGYYRINTQLEQFKQLDNYYSNQIVVKKAHTSPELFKATLKDYMDKKSINDAVRAKLIQTSLMEDESVVDARLKDAFFTQNEVQKIALDKDFIETDDFKEMYKDLYYSLEEKDGKAVFKYGNSKTVKKHDVLFDLQGYEDTVEEKLARYDGHLKLGFYSGQENIFLIETDINKLIDGKTVEEAQTYLDGLGGHFYVERSQQEMYSKLNASNVEKSKSRAIVFTPGEYDKNVANTLKKAGAEELIGSQESFGYIMARANELGIDEATIKAMVTERYAANAVIQQAFGNQGIGFWTAENSGKHKGAGGYVNDVLRTIQGVHLEKGESLDNMKRNLGDAVGDFSIASDGTLVFANGKSNANIDKLKDVIKTHYSNDIDSETLGRLIKVDGKTVATVFDTNLAQTKENDIISAHMPIELLPQVQEYDKKITHLESEIESAKAVIESFEVPDKKPPKNNPIYVSMDEDMAMRHQRIFDNMANAQRVLDEANGKLNPNRMAQNQNTYDQISTRINQINQQIATHKRTIESNVDEIVKNRTHYAPIQEVATENRAKKEQMAALKTQRQQLLEERRSQISQIDQQMRLIYADIENLEGDIKITRGDWDISPKKEQSLVKGFKKQSHENGKIYKDLARQKRELEEAKNRDIKAIDKEIYNLKQEIKLNYSIIEANESASPGVNKGIININQTARNEIEALKKEKEDLVNQRTQVRAEIVLENGRLKDANKAQRVVDAKTYYRDRDMATATQRARDKAQREANRALRGLERNLYDTKEAKFRHVSAYEARAKGIKRDDRKFAFLRNIKFNSKVFDHMPKEMLSALGIDGVDKLSYDNKPILKHVVSNMMQEAITSSKYDLLTPDSAEKVIDEFTTNENLRTGLKNIYKKTGVDNISLELIESKYIVSQMGAAREFNAGKATIEEMIDRGFEVIDIRDYTKSFNGDGGFIKKSNSIFAKDLILTVGDQKVAMPYLPSSTYGDTIVQRNYERNIVGVRDLLFEKEGLEKDSADIAEVDKKITNMINQIKTDNLNIVAKDGPIRDRLSARSNQSARAASSSYSNLYLDSDNLAANKAQFLGKSIQEWASKQDAYLDVAWGSKEFFGEMGITDDYLAKQFGDADKGWKYLEKNGVQGFITRDPILEKGSYKAGRLYLDDTLKGNSIKTTHHTQISLAGDHDGDTNGFDVARFMIDGKMQNSLELRDNPLANEYLQEIDTLMGINATTINKKLAQDLKSAYSDPSLVAQNQRYTEIAQKNYQKILDNKFGESVIGEELSNPYFSYGPEEISRLKGRVEELGQMIDINYDSPSETYEKLQALDISPEDKKAFEEDFRAYASIARRENTADTKVFKNAIGEVNLKLYEMRSQSETLLNHDKISSADFMNIQEMTYALEQEVISSKNANGAVNINATHDLKRIINGAYYNRELSYNGKTMMPGEAISKFIDDNIGEETFMNKYSNRSNELGSTTYAQAKESMVNSMSFYNNQEMHATRDYFKLFTRNSNTMHYSNTANAEAGAQDLEGMMGFMYNMADPYSDNPARVNVNAISGQNHTYAHMFADNDTVEKAIQNSQAKLRGTNALLENVGSEFKPSKAMAGLAVAGIGAYMLMGAVGNSVTANTTNQAEQFQGDTLSDYGSDYSVEQQTSQSQASGYVVNVRAKTNPENIQKMAGQFNQSISQSLNANLNMTLNINEQSPKQFQIDKMIQDSIFNR